MPSQRTGSLLAACALLAMGCPSQAADPSAQPNCRAGERWDGHACVATLLPAKPHVHSPEGIDVSGTFTVAGVRADGKPYDGSAIISRVEGAMFHVKWTIGNAPYEGVAIRDGDLLSAGWSESAGDSAVVSYLVQPTAKGPTLDGIWFGNGMNGLGREVLIGGTSNLTGIWSIREGVDESGQTYGGTVSIGLTDSVHHLTWQVGEQTYRGLGLRNAAGDVFSCGFNSTGNFGVVQYQIVSAGAKLVGKWAEWTQSTPTLGTETLTRH